MGMAPPSAFLQQQSGGMMPGLYTDMKQGISRTDVQTGACFGLLLSLSHSLTLTLGAPDRITILLRPCWATVSSIELVNP